MTTQDATRAIIDHYAARRAECLAEGDTPPVVRDCLLKAIDDGEYHTLFAVLRVPHLRESHDTVLAAERLDAINADYHAR